MFVLPLLSLLEESWEGVVGRVLELFGTEMYRGWVLAQSTRGLYGVGVTEGEGIGEGVDEGVDSVDGVSGVGHSSGGGGRQNKSGVVAKRDGKWVRLREDELVVGDVIELVEGNKVKTVITLLY